MGFTPAMWLICCSWEDLAGMKLNGAGNGLSQYNIAVISVRGRFIFQHIRLRNRKGQGPFWAGPVKNTSFRGGGDAVQTEREGRGVHPPARVGQTKDGGTREAETPRQGREGAPEEAPPHEVLQVRDGDDQPGLQGDHRRSVHELRGALPRQGGT